jgi:Protein of unknown function (DUF354)
MTICFIANFTKTYFFHEIATLLQANSIAVYWIVVNRKLRDFLIDKYGIDAVLYLSKDEAEHEREPIGNFRLNELIYLNNIQRPVYDFLKKNDVQFVFGELTWAHEILIHRLVTAKQELNCVYYNPQSVRLPKGRFGFFTDEFESELALLSNSTKDRHASSPAAIQVEKPDYLVINDQRLQQARTFGHRLARLKRYFTMENIDSRDPTLIANRWLSFKKNAAEEINREIYNLVPKVRFDETLASRNFVFLGLHKQPEASIDVIGRYYENQYDNIVNIWRSLPDGWLFLVKEHSNAVGDRSYFFYHKLRKLRNVVLIDEKTDSFDIIRRSRAVITVSGTMAYEATLMGIPSITLGDVFFNRLPGCHKIGLDHFRVDSLSHLIEPIDAQGALTFTHWLSEHSAAGLISDPISNLSCMTTENLKQVSDAFFSVIK